MATKVSNFRVPPELMHKAKIIAAKEYTDVTSIVVELLKNYIRDYEKNNGEIKLPKKK